MHGETDFNLQRRVQDGRPSFHRRDLLGRQVGTTFDPPSGKSKAVPPERKLNGGSGGTRRLLLLARHDSQLDSRHDAVGGPC